MKRIISCLIIIVGISSMMSGCNADKAENNKSMTCRLSIRCDEILQDISKINEEKTDIIPKDGVIFDDNIEFSEEESAFDIIKREMMENEIHFDFSKSPVYDSIYIKGIANIYEFDCGEMSGWLFKVNGEMPNYDCSHYQVKDGDKIELVYSCDMMAEFDME